MKSRLLFVLALAVGLAGSAVAEAQSNRKVPEVVAATIDSWTPQSGAVGTVVSVSGSGFTRNVLVLVGGRRVRPIKMGSRVISFKIPANHGDGRIVIRQAGVAQDFQIGQFEVWANPIVRSFSPSSGAPGTRVEIRGSDFSRDDLVMLGTQSLAIESYSSTSIVVTIPPGAATAPFTVENSRRVVFTSRRQFKVVEPAPYISNFSPTHGQPGTLIKIRGGNYGKDIRVSYGRKTVPVYRRGEGWLEVFVPANARNNATFSISSRRGGTRSALEFSLEMPPILSSYTPSWGGPGSRVTLNGRNFRAEDKVTLGGIDCQSIAIGERQITIEVPPNATSGAFAIVRDTQEVVAATQFSVLFAPVISSLAPMRGPPGTRIVVRGDHLAEAKVFLGTVQIRPQLSLFDQLQIVIPQGAVTGTLRVTTRGGSANYAEPFEVWNFPSIKRLSPSRGPVGTMLTISGAMLGNATAIFIGDAEAPILSRTQRGKITVQIPNRALSGSISWTAYGRNTMSDAYFTVVRPPVLRGFTPAAGAAGSTVIIEGENFEERTRVRYGNANARVLKWEPNRLTVQIPPRARQSDVLSVQGEAGSVAAPTAFDLLIAPTARSFSPTKGKPGAELTIFGSGLASSTLVEVGGVPATVLSAPLGGASLTVSLPLLAPGKYDVSVQSRGMRTVARKRLKVEGHGMVSEISPNHARVGQKIMLRGEGLLGVRVFYGSRELPVVKADRRGRKLWVTIPEGCTGSSALIVVDEGHRSTSTVVLQIDVPEAPPPE